MTERLPTLEEAFLSDHRRLTQGLGRLRKALREKDLRAAHAAADELDAAAGPHIEFEERIFYPTLETLLGSDFVDRLFHEHVEGERAVRQVLAMPPGSVLPERERQRLVDQVEVALEHALSCGSLLSHLDRLDEGRRRELLDALLRLRARGCRWTEFAARVRRG